jgi:hypothetical protein
MLDRLPSSARIWVAAALAVIGIIAQVFAIRRTTEPEEGPPPGFNPATALQDNLKSIQNNPNMPPDVKAKAIAALQGQMNANAGRQQALQVQNSAMDAQTKAAANAPVKK